MQIHETPQRANGVSRNDDSTQSYTDRLIANADALLEDAGRSIAENNVSLKQSRAFLSAADTTHAHEAVNRVWSELIQEMVEAGENPTAGQLESWRDRLTTVAEFVKAREAEEDGQS